MSIDIKAAETQSLAALKTIRLGFALTGSLCTLRMAVEMMAHLRSCGALITPILSTTVASVDSRFGSAQDWRRHIIDAAGNPDIIDSIPLAEPIGPKKLFDILLICPCSGNTIAKLAQGIADTAVLMAAKSHLRNGRPLLIAPSTNDGLAANAKNIGELLNRKHVYFVPFGQDDYRNKPRSLLADMSQVPQALVAALHGEQLQPLLVHSIAK